MATVLTAALLPSLLGNGDIYVTITTSFSAEAISSFLPSGTLADLERIIYAP